MDIEFAKKAAFEIALKFANGESATEYAVSFKEAYEAALAVLRSGERHAQKVTY